MNYSQVSINDLGLSDIEKNVLIKMVGSRYNPGKKEIRLITEEFPNRLENKKYLTHLLEHLLAETRRIAQLDLYNLK